MPIYEVEYMYRCVERAVVKVDAGNADEAAERVRDFQHDERESVLAESIVCENTIKSVKESKGE